MKNKLTLILIAAIVVLLVANYLLGTGYLSQSRGNDTLTDNITQVSRALAQISPPAQGLEAKLAQAEAGLAAAQSDFPKDLNSTRIINTILKLADACQVKAIPLVTQPWGKEKDYEVFRLTLSASGSFPQVSSFVSRLENGELTSLIVKNLAVKAGAVSDEGARLVTATLDLTIYAQLSTTP